MTQAQWIASIEPQGTLTVAMCPNHVAQALSDGDAACAATTTTGAVSAAAIDARASLVALYSFYITESLAAAGTLLSTAARNALVNAGSSYYNTSGAP